LYDCVADGGDLVVYGLLASDRVQLPAARLVFRDVTVRGFSRLRIFAPQPTRPSRQDPARLLNAR
jgi:NADPH:quinone reductase-like Zn-dependent oxidoreductase